jgi:hypothetical protein
MNPPARANACPLACKPCFEFKVVNTPSDRNMVGFEVAPGCAAAP